MYLDLGIDLELIKVRTLAVLKFQHLDERFAKDADMSGPLLIALALGSLLLLVSAIVICIFNEILARQSSLCVYLWVWSDWYYWHLHDHKLVESSNKNY